MKNTLGDKVPTRPYVDDPLPDIEEWENFLRRRYSRDFSGSTTDVRSCVKELYRQNHAHQTLDFVLHKKRQYLSLNQRCMSVWEAMEFLNTVVDESNPDAEVSQLEHLLQSAEAVRRDGHPPWFVIAALIHDLGMILCLFGEPQWAVVGDTFPVGCKFSDKIVFPEFFEANPDLQEPQYQTRAGIYEEGCGLDNVHLSWGHDEYLYHVVKDYLPAESLYMIRYHSFFAAHHEGEYTYLMSARDREMLGWVKAFSSYDLYSKSDEHPPVEELKPFYAELIGEFFPKELRW